MGKRTTLVCPPSSQEICKQCEKGFVSPQKAFIELQMAHVLQTISYPKPLKSKRVGYEHLV
eukprot:1162021-Pelagomonas_calceolata.AAC.11